jgi:hypothetical protein
MGNLLQALAVIAMQACKASQAVGKCTTSAIRLVVNTEPSGLSLFQMAMRREEVDFLIQQVWSV